jgi:short-subunit dehydrogenase
MKMEIKGAVALVTGANGGIGNQFIETLRMMGAARIYACARNTEVASEISSIEPERVIPVQLDITNAKSVSEATMRCKDVTLLINNAGAELGKGLIAAPDLASARAEMEVNYFGTLAMCREFAPILKSNSGGAIINMLAIVARAPIPRIGSYSASKAAALSLTQGVRAELAAQGTFVVAVMPGAVDTSMSKNYPPPKVSPSVVAATALQAVIDEVEDIYPGDQAANLVQKLAIDPKAVERQLAQLLPAALVEEDKDRPLITT